MVFSYFIFGAMAMAAVSLDWDDKIDGVVKTLHLLRCYNFSIITTYPSTPKW